MPRSSTTGAYTRVSNSFSNPIVATGISPTDAASFFDDVQNALNGFLATSTSSVVVGTGSKTLTVASPSTKTFLANTGVLAFSQADTTKYITGTVTSYNNSTGALVINSVAIGAAGTVADWAIVMASGPGLPTPAVATLGGVKSNAGTTHQWIASINTDGTVTLSQPAFSDLSGAATTAQLPLPTISAIGGVQANARSANQFVTGISTVTGALTFAQPAFSDVSGTASNSQLANMAAWTFKANATSGSAAPTDITVTGLTLKASPAAADEVILWDVAGSAIKKTTVSAVSAAGSVASIAGNTGAFTLGAGLTNSTNVLLADAAYHRGYLSGLVLSTAGSSATFSVAAGVATSDDNTTLMLLASALSKTTGAWTVGTGNGSLDTGTIANSTWYHAFEIERTDTGLVDAVTSLSPTSPTMPTNYTKKRYVGSLLTNSSGQWQSFTQFGDLVLWGPPYLDVNAVTLTTANRTLYTLTVPTGVNVQALGRGQVNGTSVQCIITSPSESDTSGFTAGNGGLSLRTTAAGDTAAGQFQISTDTSARIAVRGNGTSPTFSWSTYGYINRRGRDA